MLTVEAVDSFPYPRRGEATETRSSRVMRKETAPHVAAAGKTYREAFENVKFPYRY
jgi:hypothetical protein